MNALLRRLSLAVAGCYAAVQFRLFKPSDARGPFLKCVGGNPAYVDAPYEVVFLAADGTHLGFRPCDRSGKVIWS